MKNASITPQSLGKSVKAAAREALGGDPARPPMIGAPLPTAPTAAQAAFTAAHMPAVAQVPLGNPTFDAAPPELLARRAKVDGVRQRLGDLARLILAENESLQPLISELANEAEAVKAAELFDPATARSFLADLTHAVYALQTRPAPAAESSEPTAGPEL